MTACDPRIPHEHNVSDPAEHMDDSYGGCSICRYAIPHSDDEYVSVPYPCPTVRLSGLQQERDRLEWSVDHLSVWAARYVLGRATYAVGDVVDILIANRAFLSPQSVRVIRVDVMRALGEGRAGMDMDAQQWRRLLAAFAEPEPAIPEPVSAEE